MYGLRQNTLTPRICGACSGLSQLTGTWLYRSVNNTQIRCNKGGRVFGEAGSMEICLVHHMLSPIHMPVQSNACPLRINMTIRMPWK